MSDHHPEPIPFPQPVADVPTVRFELPALVWGKIARAAINSGRLDVADVIFAVVGIPVRRDRRLPDPTEVFSIPVPATFAEQTVEVIEDPESWVGPPAGRGAVVRGIDRSEYARQPQLPPPDPNAPAHPAQVAAWRSRIRSIGGADHATEPRPATGATRDRATVSPEGPLGATARRATGARASSPEHIPDLPS